MIEEEQIICPYCKSHALLVDSKTIYGKSYGNLWLCGPCDAYVGCVKGTDRPLGTLANELDRQGRKSAHGCLDAIWKNRQRGYSRSGVYRWLADKMDLSLEECHIARFNYNECMRAVRHLREHPYYNQKKRRDKNICPETGTKLSP